MQFTGALMQEQLDVAQRLEPGTEAGLRPTDAFRNGADATSVERVEMEHAVGFAEPERAQDDSFRLVRAPGHRAVKCRRSTSRESLASLSRSPTRMARVHICIRRPGAGIASALKPCSTRRGSNTTRSASTTTPIFARGSWI